MASFEELVEQARGMQNVGDHSGAERLYVEAMDLRPGDVRVLGPLCALYIAADRPKLAIPLIEEALERSLWADGFLLLGKARLRTGDLLAAEDALKRATRIRPGLVEARVLLGDVLETLGKQSEAIASYRKAIKYAPSNGDAAAGLERLRVGGAEFPPDPDSERLAGKRYSEGLQHQLNGRLPRAAESYRAALQAQPNHVGALDHLGATLFTLRLYAEAEEIYRRLIEAKPNDGAVQIDFAASLNAIGCAEEAVREARRGLELAPENAGGYAVLGAALGHLDQVDEAIETCRKAVELAPTSVDAHVALAIYLLKRGDYEEGWREYEWRTRRAGSQLRTDVRRWDGRPLDGKTLLCFAEQGLGDAIQFVRYVPMLKERGAGKIVLATYPALVDLFRGVEGCDEVVPLNVKDRTVAGGPYDAAIALMSLPFLLGTTLDTIPADVPYLGLDPNAVERARAFVGDGLELKIGLRWSGSANTPDISRTCTLAELGPLASVPDATFYNLNADAGVNDAPASGLRLIDVPAELYPFPETAALISRLDLVITVDTVFAHLAGALAKPVWIALDSVSEWRWLSDRDDSPWYPTARLFRRSPSGTWTNLFETIARQLEAHSIRG